MFLIVVTKNDDPIHPRFYEVKDVPDLLHEWTKKVATHKIQWEHERPDFTKLFDKIYKLDFYENGSWTDEQWEQITAIHREFYYEHGIKESWDWCEAYERYVRSLNDPTENLRGGYDGIFYLFDEAT